MVPSCSWNQHVLCTCNSMLRNGCWMSFLSIFLFHQAIPTSFLSFIFVIEIVADSCRQILWVYQNFWVKQAHFTLLGPYFESYFRSCFLQAQSMDLRVWFPASVLQQVSLDFQFSPSVLTEWAARVAYFPWFHWAWLQVANFLIFSYFLGTVWTLCLQFPVGTSRPAASSSVSTVLFTSDGRVAYWTLFTFLFLVFGRKDETCRSICYSRQTLKAFPLFFHLCSHSFVFLSILTALLRRHGIFWTVAMVLVMWVPTKSELCFEKWESPTCTLHEDFESGLGCRLSLQGFLTVGPISAPFWGYFCQIVYVSML